MPDLEVIEQTNYNILMTETAQPFTAGIIDFNLKRMSPEEAGNFGIPTDLIQHLGDYRQYPPNIARHFPEGVSWYRSDQPWYFAEVMGNDENVRRLRESDVLILSGSGLSAHGFQHGKISEEYRPALERSQEVIRDHLGEGKWVLGICFGGQLAVDAVGGEIGRLPEGITEAGWLDHSLTPQGKQDEVFCDLPKQFSAPHFHNDFVAKLPAIGTKVRTSNGEIEVTRAETLAIRSGYKDKEGLKNTDTEYIMASVIEFDNGAKIYQIQPHPEMATREKANFLVRMNQWLAKDSEMGQDYYDKALSVPEDADFSVTQVIPNFVVSAQKHLEDKRGITFLKATMVQNLFQYLLK